MDSHLIPVPEKSLRFLKETNTQDFYRAVQLADGSFGVYNVKKEQRLDRHWWMSRDAIKVAETMDRLARKRDDNT